MSTLILWMVLAAPSLEVRDDLNRAVSIDLTRPLRVVSLAPNITELLIALQLGSSIVGVTSHCPREGVFRAAEIVGDLKSFSKEKIVSLRPTVAIASTDGNDRFSVETLHDAGVPVYAVSVHSFDELRSSIDRLARALNQREQSERLIATLAAEWSSIEARDPPVPLVLVVGHDPWFVVGGRGWISDVIARAGGKNIFPEPERYVQVGTELLWRRIQPDTRIIVLGRASSRIFKTFRSRCVRSLPEDLLSRVGAGMPKAARLLADRLRERCE